MRIKRNLMNQMIAEDVMSGVWPAYHNSKNGNKCWSLYRGSKGLYSEANTNSPKNTLVLHNGSQSSYVSLSCDSVEMAEYITNHEMNFTKTLKRDKARSEYLASEEGKWGRQDSFDDGY
jgi:hypothetical protein